MVLRTPLGRLPPVLVMVTAIALAVASCADGNSSGPGLAAIEQGASSLDSRAYRLGVGDKIKITVFGEQELSGPLEINVLGNVPAPLIGEVPAKGRTVDEVKSAIARSLANGYLVDPKITIEVLTYRPFFIHGEVRNSGEFPFKNGIRLRDAIAIAGGYTYRADKNFVLLTREGAAQEVKVPLPNDVIVLPGDNLRIPERFF